jgi:hypothetical protein
VTRIRARYLAPACLALALAPSPVGSDAGLPARACPTAIHMGAALHAPWERVDAACDAEVELRDAGWGDGWVGGALANAWWESRWNPRVVDTSGRTVGFWQLRDDGLGRGMGDLRFDVPAATGAVIRSAQRQGLDVSRGSGRSAARTFCLRIMRPSDAARKGDIRSETRGLDE